MQIKRALATWIILAVSASVLQAAPPAGGTKSDAGSTSEPTTAPAFPEAMAAAAHTTESGDFMRQLRRDFAAHDYEKAAQTCQGYLELNPTSSFGRFNLARALARLGRKDEAIMALQMAVAGDWNDPDTISDGDDFKPLRDDERFALVLAKAQSNLDHIPIEKGEAFPEIPGVKIKTVEDRPKMGLRYRLRMSAEATAQKPNRLVIWLHPTGASDDWQVERLAPMLIKHGFALVVFTQKQYQAWTPPEVDALFNTTLPVLGKIPGLDARQPILMGFSRGAEIALGLYYQSATYMSGLVINASYPLDLERSTPQNPVLHTPAPSGPGVKECPILVFLGEKDGFASTWKTAATEWPKAGVPLIIYHVPNAGHAYMLKDKQIPLLEDWITSMAAGQTPTSRPMEIPKPAAPATQDTAGN